MVKGMKRGRVTEEGEKKEEEEIRLRVGGESGGGVEKRKRQKWPSRGKGGHFADTSRVCGHIKCSLVFSTEKGQEI